MEGKQVSSRLLSRRRKMAGITEPTNHLTLEEVIHRQAQSHIKWKQNEKQATKQRTTFLDERVNELMSQGQTTRAKAITTLHHREHKHPSPDQTANV